VELIARTMVEAPEQIDDHVVRKGAQRMRQIRATENYRLMKWLGMVRTVDRDDSKTGIDRMVIAAVPGDVLQAVSRPSGRSALSAS
jgi:hypothetical protein